MGVLSDFFIADSASVPDYQGGEPFAEDDKCQSQNLTPLQAAQFLAVLRGQKYVADMIREFELVTPDDADEWTMTVPDDMVKALANIESSRIEDVASRFSEITRKELGCSSDDFKPLLSKLAALAQRAMATRKKMYLWNSL